jgi:succinate dehydrogenase hydrophobic anchor subunit
MIQVEKLKTMTQLALYEKKQGKKDFSVFRYRREDYIQFEKIKTVIAATAAFLIIGGFLAAWNIEVILSHFDTYDYKQIGAAILVAYLVFLIFYVRIVANQSRERYNTIRPRMRRYHRNLSQMTQFYKDEDKVRKEFEKGEWRDGK